MTDVLPLVRGELSPRTPGGRSVIWAATGRFGGASEGAFASANLAEHVGDDLAHVRRNRASVRDLIGATSLIALQAEHGPQVLHVSSGDSSPKAGCDGLTTTDSGAALLALGADCATIVLTDGHVLGIGHCGWAGLVANLPAELLLRARERSESNKPRMWQAIVGPTICAQCYSVSAERRSEIRARATQVVASAALMSSAHGVDVRAGVHAALRHAAAQCGDLIDITDVDRCTYESSDLYSYRRDGVTGRHGLVAAFASADLEATQ